MTWTRVAVMDVGSVYSSRTAIWRSKTIYDQVFKITTGKIRYKEILEQGIPFDKCRINFKILLMTTLRRM